MNVKLRCRYSSVTDLSASRYSPMFREERGASASDSASAIARASLRLLDPDCAGITSQNT
jgi:hypothetical protein